MVDNLTIQAVEPMYHAGYPLDAAAVLLIELDGLREDVAVDAAEIDDICRRAGAYDIRMATAAAERELLWKGRKMALAAMGRLAPNYYLHDTVVPRSKLPQTLREVERITTRERVALRQRLPRWRRQPAPADAVRPDRAGLG